MKSRNIKASDLAIVLNLHVHSIYDMLKHENIDIYRLIQLSEILDYDFFQNIHHKTKNVTWCDVTIEGEKIVITKRKD